MEDICRVDAPIYSPCPLLCYCFQGSPFSTFQPFDVSVMGNLYTSFLILQEVDEPLQLDMSELCLNDDFSHGNDGKQLLRNQHTIFLDICTSESVSYTTSIQFRFLHFMNCSNTFS